MIVTLGDTLHNFSGPVNCARCLAHIVNLVARAVLHQFDVSKGHDDEASEGKSRAEEEVQSITDSDEDDMDTAEELLEKEDNEIDNNDKKGVDLTEVEQVTREKTESLRHALYKVSTTHKLNTHSPLFGVQAPNFRHCCQKLSHHPFARVERDHQKACNRH
jgi:hypothetical protein